MLGSEFIHLVLSSLTSGLCSFCNSVVVRQIFCAGFNQVSFFKLTDVPPSSTRYSWNF